MSFEWHKEGISIPYNAGAEVYVECPKCSGQRKKKDKPLKCNTERGLFFCFYCGWSGRVTDERDSRVMRYDGIAKTKPMPRIVRSSRQVQEPNQKQGNGIDPRKMLRKTWMGALPLVSGDPVIKYLSGRDVLPNVWPTSLRHHPALVYRHDDGRKSPYHAMLGLVRSPSYEAVCIHRTYLTPEGEKAPVDVVKKLMSPVAEKANMGAAIRLVEPESVLGIAEGIETALSVIKYANMPCWSTISAGGMRAVIVPAHVKEVVIWGDHDETGINAANELALRMVSERRVAKIMIPEKPGSDWADRS